MKKSGKNNNRMRMSHRLVIKPKLAQRKILIAGLCILITSSLIVVLNFMGREKAMAAANGDYRSVSSGNWNSIATWQKFNGTSWVAATAAPTNTDGAISIQNGNTVTVTASVSADQLTINTGGQLTLSNGSLSVLDGAGDDLIVDGTLLMNSTLALKTSSTCKVNNIAIMNTGGNLTFQTGAGITINNGGRYRKDNGSQTVTAGYWVVNTGGVYQHNDNGTSLPNCTWNAGSTCEITGTTTTKPSNLNQSFSNFTWDCSNQTSFESIGSGGLNSINGDLKIVSTGSGAIQMNSSSNITYSVTGNFIQQGGVVYFTESGGCILNITGDFIQSGGNFNLTDGVTANGSGKPIININGNYIISNGTFNMSQYTGINSTLGIGTVNLNGNFTFSGGTITETATSAGHGEFNFTKTGTQDVTGGGSISSTINFTVKSGAILNLGTSTISGAGNFTVSNGAGLNIGSENGITTSGATGNIQVSGTRSFSTTADYFYSGSASQIAGNGFPAAVHNFTVNNSAGITLSSNLTVANQLTLTAGKITTNSYELNVTNASTSAINGYSASSYINGNLRRSINSTGSYDFPVGSASNYELASLNLNAVTGASSILASFTNANPIETTLPLVGINVNGSSITEMLDYGYWTLTPNSVLLSGNYDVTLKETGHSNSASNPGAYCVIKRANILFPWTSLGSHNNSTQSETGGVVTAVRTGLTSFSNFGIGKGGGALPIELIYFKAIPANDKVNLTWATAAEKNNDFFTVERSIDQNHFEKILTKPGAGNSNITCYYKAEDEQPYNGISYYRLKQTDYDGHFTYSKICVVNRIEKKESSISINSIGPNPFNQNLALNYSCKSAVEIMIMVLNFGGQTIYKKRLMPDEGINQIDLNECDNWPVGEYLIMITDGNERITRKIIKGAN